MGHRLTAAARSDSNPLSKQARDYGVDRVFGQYAIEHLRLEHGIRRISAVGGRLTATSLVDDGLVQDVYLTTSSRAGGAPGTPWYGGTHSLALTVTTRKEWMDEGSRLIFEHILVGDS